jgi:hypothetical protein
LLPGTVRQATAGWDRNALAERVLADCFGWQAGDKPVLRLIKATSGELGLGLLRGDTSHYYGVVNVGDAVGLRKSLESVALGRLSFGEDLWYIYFSVRSPHRKPIRMRFNLMIGDYEIRYSIPRAARQRPEITRTTQ